MEILEYILLTILAFSGTIFGLTLSNIASEELSVSAKYLKIFSAAIFAIIASLLLLDYGIIYALGALVLALAVMMLFVKDRHWITFNISAIALALGTHTSRILEISIAIFIYAITIVSIDASSIFKNGKIKKGDNKKLLQSLSKKYIAFIIISMIAYFIFK